jgi:hypothetical protein
VHFDAYSPRAKEEFRELKQRLQSVPIVSMLTQELAKIRIDRPLTERLVRTTKALDPDDRERVVDLLLDNLDTLYPIFTTVTMQLRAILDELPEAYKTKTIHTIRALLKDGSYVTRIPVHTVFAMRILAHDLTPETSGVLTSIYHASKSPMIRRDAILIMAARGASEWIEDLTGTFDRLHEWEKRALIIGSHCLRGGQLWRAKLREPLGPFDQELIDWIDSRPKDWEIPM